MKCPNCGADNQTGKFCAECGAGLDTSCPSCGEAVTPGARYCTSCGEPIGSSGGGGVPGSKAGWIIAAAAIVVVLLVVLLPRATERVPAPPVEERVPVGAPTGTGGGQGVLSADMRTNADRLYNRIMAAAEQGNQAEVDQFMPMAIQAYEAVEGLDEDGLYHLALLNITAGDYDAGRAAAQRILDRSPGHILALGALATAATEAGDEAAARDHWQRLLEAYPQEVGKPLPEYMDHQNMMSEYQRMALEATD